MGGQQSNNEQHKQQVRQSDLDEDDHYILEKLESVSLKNTSSYVYFWIDPKIYNSQNAKYQQFLNKSFEVQGLSSVEGLEAKMDQYPNHKQFKVICAASLNDKDYSLLSENPRIKTMILFCQNQERAKLLINNFPKILFARFDIIDLRNSILQLQEQEDDSDSKSNILFLIQEDAKLLNQYRINFHSLTCKNSQKKSKQDFIKIALHLFSEQKSAIKDFEEDYKITLSKEERSRKCVNQAMKKGFFWDLVYSLPRLTTNPKVLAYLRFAFRELYEGIRNTYEKKSGQAYMVLTLTQQELAKMNENVKNFILFTSFVKAFTNEKTAYQLHKKTPGSFFVRMILPPLHPGNSIESLDFGYSCVPDNKEDPNIIFNIYNLFLVEDFEQQLKQITLSYGSLSQVSYKREHRRDTYRLNPFEENLMRNYDYLQDLTSNINSQATVLQISGFFKQSLEVHEKKFAEIRKSQPGQEVLDRQTIELGDAYKRNGEYSIAQKHYLSVIKGKAHFKALVHLAELYLCTHEQKKLENTIKQIEDTIEKNQEKDAIEVFKGRNYIGMQMMENKRYAEASKLFKKLLGDISSHYNYKFEGIPLVHEIYTNRATCLTQLKNYPQALSLLDTTKSWQRICQGKESKSFQRTQTLIKSVHQSKGETYHEESSYNKFKQSGKEKAVKQLPKQTAINQSDFQIIVDSQPPKKPNKNTTNLQPIEQSAINIETSIPTKNSNKPAKLLQESAINIDF